MYVFESQYALQSQCKCSFESHCLHILESVCYWLAGCVVLQTLCLQVFQVQFKANSSQVAWQDTKRVIFGLQGTSPRPLLTLWEGTPMPPLQANTPASPTLDASPPLQSRKQQEVREQGASPILLIAHHQPKIAIACHMHLQSSFIISRCNCWLQPTLQTYFHLNCLQFPTLGQRYDELQFYPDILAKQVFPPRLSQSSSHYMSGTNVGLRDHT